MCIRDRPDVVLTGVATGTVVKYVIVRSVVNTVWELAGQFDTVAGH